MRRRGFTLIELLSVLAILSLLLVVAAPLLSVTTSMRLGSATSLLTSQIETAKDRAAAAARGDARSEYAGRHVAGFAGLRLTETRLIPLRAGGVYTEGRIAIHDSYPAGFAPPVGRLVLEEAVRDVGGTRNNPTSWAWNVRLGDAVHLHGRDYLVCGPMVEPNAEGYVNYGPAGATTGLDRGDGPAEYLLLSNGLDDDGDGITDDGRNGIDDDLDGATDDDDEWEIERWIGLSALGETSGAYRIIRRPTPIPYAESELPSGVVLDRNGSTIPGAAAEWPVDLIFDQYGSARVSGWYGVAPLPLGAEKITLRLQERADAASAVRTTIDMRTGGIKAEGGE